MVPEEAVASARRLADTESSSKFSHASSSGIGRGMLLLGWIISIYWKTKHRHVIWLHDCFINKSIEREWNTYRGIILVLILLLDLPIRHVWWGEKWSVVSHYYYSGRDGFFFSPESRKKRGMGDTHPSPCDSRHAAGYVTMETTETQNEKKTKKNENSISRKNMCKRMPLWQEC